jgi:sugar lactone lactonase YvrE
MRLSSFVSRAVVVLVAALSFVWLASRSRPPAGLAGVQPLLFGSGLHQPRSLAFALDGSLIVGEVGGAAAGPGAAPAAGRVVRLDATGALSVLVDGLPPASPGQPLFAQSGPTAILGPVATGARAPFVFTGPEGGDRLGRLSRLVEIGGEWRLDPLARLDDLLPGTSASPAAVWGPATARGGPVYATLPMANQLVRVQLPGGGAPDTVSVTTVTGFVDSGQRNPLPSGATVAPDGSVYVALFGPEPFQAGTGRIVRVEADGRWRPAFERLSFPVALAFGPDGQLLVLEYATEYDGRLGRFRPNSGRLLSVGPGPGRRRTVARDIHLPTAMTFSAAGDVYFTESVTTGDAANGNVLRVPAQTLRSYR